MFRLCIRLDSVATLCLQDEVIVRVHEAPGVARPLCLPRGSFEEREELESIDVVDEETLAVHASGGNVVDALGR